MPLIKEAVMFAMEIKSRNTFALNIVISCAERFFCVTERQDGSVLQQHVRERHPLSTNYALLLSSRWNIFNVIVILMTFDALLEFSFNLCAIFLFFIFL